MRLYVRELAFGCVLAIVSNVAVVSIVDSSPELAERLGLYSTSWVNGMLFVEILRMLVVGVLTLLAIRQRHGLETRGEGVVYALTVAVSSWLVMMIFAVALSFLASSILVSWSDAISLVVWCAGASLAPIFVAPARSSAEANRYVLRLDRDKSESAGW